MIFLLFFLLCITPVFIIPIDLNNLALKYGTDKGSTIHNYTETYEPYFQKIQHAPLRFLEIGIADGASARMWEEYFDNATLFFLDIEPKTVLDIQQKLSQRSHCFIGDQENQEQLSLFIEQSGGAFDIIIDDGGHTMQQQITSFKALFPSVKKNGIYIIEDLHTSFWQKYGGSGTQEKPYAGPQTTLHFLKELAMDVNTTGGYTGLGDLSKCPSSINEKLSYFQQHIKSIHFYNSLCFIFKR